MSTPKAVPAAEPSQRAERSVVRWVACLALLPTPLWFLFAVLRDPGPAWRAEYHGSQDFSGSGVVVSERRLSRYWDRQDPVVPGGFEVSAFSVRFDTCLRLREARVIPFLLVATGSASFAIDEQERLRVDSGKERGTRGAEL